MARKNTGWLSEDGKVHDTREAADDHDAAERIKAIIADVSDTAHDGADEGRLVRALATDAVISDLRRLAPAKPRKPRVVKAAKTEPKAA